VSKERWSDMMNENKELLETLRERNLEEKKDSLEI